MELLTLQQVFGSNATQDSQYLTILKADYPSLSPSVNNTSESLLIAILLKALENFEGYLTTESGEIVTTESGISITYKNIELFKLISIEKWKDYFTKKPDLRETRTLIFQIYQAYEY